ncbi:MULTISPECIES: WXG100 family type VII secretion target [Bacillus]|uniref:WXG100 family type VII secretion target n=1 Tax=Bacillus TaxID=1386 RepID=UPI0019118CA6|nr:MULTISPECIES: WXG100 family type VII secretion target [Bacillus]MBK5474019.1 WXG100 family type VII secretion target [Bacillus sp. TH19]WOA59498.1 WXG100 family type VII secretion target [Bacillus mycoides]
MEIKVKPEQLEQIAKNISEMQTHSQNIQQNLNQSMFSIQMQWQGATSQHFYGEYMRSMRLMESYIRNLQVTEKELRRIAQKFRQADEEYQKKQNEKLKETHKKEKKHEKSWWEKGIEGAAEFIGVNDAIRAVTGKDPITGKELSTKERLIAAGWTLLNFVPVGKVASLAGKGIKYVASSFGKTIVKAGKGLGEGITMVAGKAGKAAVDGIKTATHKVKEGVNFVASTAKGFADKIGSLWNKGATTVKTTFLQGNEKIQYAVKTLLEYKWIPGLGKAYVMPGVGMVREMGQHSLKDAYQYMKSVGEKGVKGTGEGSKIENISKLTTEDIPTAKSGKFNDFFNSLSSAELDGLWKDKKIRKKIERQLREPGGLHEWHLVSRAPQFKFWDISAEKIKDLRTAISDVKFVNPKGVHGGLGSTKAHNELLAIIDTSNDYNTFIRRLNNWAYYRLEGGISSLPEGLRLK